MGGRRRAAFIGSGLTVAGAAILVFATWAGNPVPSRVGVESGNGRDVVVVPDTGAAEPVPTALLPQGWEDRGPSEAVRYLESNGLKVASVERVGPWMSDDQQLLGASVEVKLGETSSIPASAPVLERTRSSCEAESDDVGQCEGLFAPTPSEPFRVAVRPDGLTGKFDFVWVLVDLRDEKSNVASVVGSPRFG